MDYDVMKEHVLEKIYNDPSIIPFIKDKYLTDELWMYCIEREPSVFEEMKKPDEKICNFAVEIDGNNLRFIREKFTYVQITERMAYIAVKNAPRAILYVPQKILSGNNGLKEMAFDKDPSLMIYFDDIRPDYIRKKVLESPSCLKYIKSPDEDLVCDALIQNPNICVYIDKLTPKMLDTLKIYHPHVYELQASCLPMLQQN